MNQRHFGGVAPKDTSSQHLRTQQTAHMDELMPFIRERLENGQSVRFSPRGVSMLPMLRQGRDTVTLSPLPDRIRKYDLPLYQRANGQYVLHRVVDVGDTYTCIGDNQYVLEKGVEHCRMIALVTEFTRDGRTCPVGALRYRIYCRFWHYSRPIRRLWRAIKTRVARVLKNSKNSNRK